MQQTVVNDRYSISRTLGSGGMARVYLAHDEILDRDVALKVLREQFAEDGEFVERFKREAQNAAALSHPNIVQVYDRGKARDDVSYIAMEYVPGGTLKERISWSGPLDPGVAASIALQIAEALNAAHERGVVHRDIKPQNVLLTATGDAKVADFGIARAASATTISQRSVVLGTASYMSPEQAMGEPVGPASDLYSLGVVLYEMLTGELPYTAESPVAVSMKHVNEPPRPPKEVNPRIPEGVNALVVKLLAKDPEDRYAGATELVEDLRRVRDGLPPVAADPAVGVTRVRTQATRPLPATRGSMPWILAATLALLILLGGVGWALSQGDWDSTREKIGRAVPDVEGLTEEQAQRKLTASGFEVEAQPRQSSAADVGKVLAQSPAAGKRVENGSRVTIEVGEGPPTTRVPYIIGLSVSDAKATLGEAELIVGSQRKVPSDTVAEGVIVEQGYPPGTEVESETPVNISVSSGPQRVATSDASSTPSPTSATASAAATAQAAEVDGEEDNSGPGSDNSGPGSSGDGGD
jgi:eukaryotic-like serine/threonine-protein kinase